jgi:hypothetical protein
MGLIALTCLSLAGLSTPSQGATTVHSVTTTLSPFLNSPYTFPAAPLPKFDIPGQCLTSVCVRLEGQSFGFVSLENFDNFAKVVNVTWSAKFDLFRPSLVPLLAATPTLLKTYSLTAFDGGVDYAGTSGVTDGGLAAAAADSTCLTSPADLALFSGPGTINLPVTVANTSTHNGANSWSFGIQAAAIIKVTYTHTPCATPVRSTSWSRVKNLYR